MVAIVAVIVVDDALYHPFWSSNASLEGNWLITVAASMLRSFAAKLSQAVSYNDVLEEILPVAGFVIAIAAEFEVEFCLNGDVVVGLVVDSAFGPVLNTSLVTDYGSSLVAGTGEEILVLLAVA